MSTTFAIKVVTDTEPQLLPIAHRYSIGKGMVGITWFIPELKEDLAPDVLVFPLDNSAQGVETVRDLKLLNP